MNKTQGAQGLDEMELAQREGVKLLIALDDLRQLQGHLRAIPGEKHPQILYRRAGTRIVQVDEVGPGIGPEHITRVAVSMQADGCKVPRLGEGPLNPAQAVGGDLKIGSLQLGGHRVALLQKAEGICAKTLGGQLRALLEGVQGADGMDAPHEPSHPEQVVEIVQLWGATAAPRVEGEAKALVFKE